MAYENRDTFLVKPVFRYPADVRSFHTKAQHLLTEANIEINGKREWDIQVHNDRFYQRVFAKGLVGLGESYMDQWWDVQALDQFFYKVLSARLDSRIRDPRMVWLVLKSKIFNLQSMQRAFQVGQAHYDIGNDLFNLMLDKRLTYTCGYWKKATDLNQAQEDKLDLVCRKIGLGSHQRILDIGCGWGSFLKFAAENYGAESVGITISREQAEFAKQNCAGLPVEIRLQDYRQLNEKFDHIISLGMFEHVGPKNHEKYMQVVSHCLKEGGIFLLQTIGAPKTRHSSNPWINKYIFPNGLLPSMRDISHAVEKHFVLEDFHNFGADYDKTLMAWFYNFDSNWKKISKKYGTRFYRMWKYYLLSCAGAFRARDIQLWQLVFSKNGVFGGYTPVA